MKSAPLLISFRHDPSCGYYAIAPAAGLSISMRNASDAAKKRARKDLEKMATATTQRA